MATGEKIILQPTGELIEVAEEARSKKMQDAFAVIFNGCQNKREFAQRCADIKDVMAEFLDRIEAEEGAAEDGAAGPEFRLFMAAALKALKFQLATGSLSARERMDIEAMVARCEDYFSKVESLN